MKLIIEKIRWRNILSYGNYWTDFDFTSHQTTIITGKNGGGKSTILSAICFGLFGKPFIDINKPNLLNWFTNKELVVEIFFKVGTKQYRILRGIKPNVFEIYENGILLNQSSETKDYQKVLENNILKCNFNSFRQVVVLGSGNYTPFMKLVPAKRKEVVEDMLILQIFTSMQVILKKSIDDLNTLVDKKRTDSRNKTTEIERIEYSSKQVQQNNDELIKVKLEEKANAEKELKEFEEKYKLVKGNLLFENGDNNDSIKKIKEKVKKTSETLYQLKAKKDKIQKEIDFFIKHDNCPTCTQSITNDFRDRTVDENKHQLVLIEKAQGVIDVKLDGLLKEQIIFEENKEKAYNANLVVEQLDWRIKNQKLIVDKIDTEIKNLQVKNKTVDRSKEIKALKKEVTVLEREYDELKLEWDHHKASLAAQSDH